ncbi:glycosyltransferase family 4 protein [Xanthobacter aminoxidans]|uniref:glycosyltransferase family 4 protein n=1 Tax=Xanthobacter aminoxidans TaxID=186280 RepID=UPI00372A033E
MSETCSGKISVVHLAPYRNTRGGIASYVQNYMASQLARQRRMVVIETHTDGSKLDKAKTAVLAFAQSFGYALSNKPDIVHVHVGDFPSLYRKAVVFFPFTLVKTKKLLHFHGAAFLTQYEKKSLAQKWLIKRIMRSFDKVICLSHNRREDLQRNFTQLDAVVVQNAVPLPEETAGARAPGAPLQVLFLGLIGPRKGLFDLLDAIDLLITQGVEVLIEMGGNGDIERLQARLDASPELKKRACFLGWVTPERRREASLKAHVFALPSYAEGMPMAIMEAMAFGLPIISTPVGGIPEIVEDGVNGRLVSPGNPQGLAEALRQLNDDEALRAEMGRRSRDVIEKNFDFSAHLSRIGEVYESLGAHHP